MDEEEAYNDLNLIWEDCPAFFIDWLRERKDDIKKHIEDCNQFINEMIDIIK